LEIEVICLMKKKKFHMYANEVKKIKGGTNVKSYGQMLYAKTRSKTTDGNKKLYESVWQRLKNIEVE